LKTLPPLFDITRILPLLQEGTLILTPNNRLRSKILQAWEGHQSSQGIKVWPTPRIQVLDQWFNQQWQQLQAQGHADTAQIIASSEQHRVIWESITADCGLMQTEAVAKQAANAYNTLKRWGLSTKRCGLPNTADSNINPQFVQWVNRYEAQLSALNCITNETSYTIIGDAFANGLLPPEESIHLLGFDDLAPLIQSQLNKISATVITLPSADHQATSLQRLSFNTTEDEMNAAAQWARGILATQEDVRIGIIAPNLGQCRKQVEFAFTAEFEAHSLAPNNERYTLPFNVSAGTPLGDTALISSTINYLKLSNKLWDTGFIESILSSPFWGHYNAELEPRCALINKLQQLGSFTISDSTLRYWAEKIDQQYRPEDEEDDNSTGLFHYFNELNNLKSTLKNTSKQHPSAWVDSFLQQLEILQWPGERTPDSQEYQQSQLWYQLLETFASLDSVLGAIDHSSAVQQLQQMANTLPFQPKVPDSPIQILGILEGAGLHFSHCWIMGLHQQAWPPAPAPNSLLPIRLQREHDMPHASSLRELHYAQSLTDNYRHCADSIIFSSPSYEDDSEQALLPSQLIADIPLGELHTQAAEDSLQQWNQQLKNHPELELVNCEQAPHFLSNTIPGGSDALKAQANNPFDSFAKYRLKASMPNTPVSGFSSIDKGNILHNALAIIWGELKDQNSLIQLTDEALDQCISHSVNRCISDIRKHRPAHLSESLCQIESERQSPLIKAWLNYEKTRSAFTVVAIEVAQTLNFGGKEFNIRIDRVDQLPDGSFLIIDYKSGTPSVSEWKGERPKEPQLPLYALCYSDTDKPADGQQANDADNKSDKNPDSSTTNNRVKGISFAEINIKDQQFKGLGEANIAQGIGPIEKNRAQLPKTWDEALNQWHKVLEQLLQQFVSGDCRIDYRDQAALTSTENYNKDYLRLNRFYEAEAIKQRIINQQQKG
jgi:ATP-dependent helicase/nuclease subunit B